MSIVADKIIKGITANFINELDERYYDYNEEVVESIVRESVDQKENLIKIFRKHPNWDEEKLMVKFDENYTRKINREEVNQFMKWLEAHTPALITPCGRNIWRAENLHKKSEE